MCDIHDQETRYLIQHKGTYKVHLSPNFQLQKANQQI